jgi:hypothetical protein
VQRFVQQNVQQIARCTEPVPAMRAKISRKISAIRIPWQKGNGGGSGPEIEPSPQHVESKPLFVLCPDA